MTNDKNAKDEFLGLSIDEIVERVNKELSQNPEVGRTSGHPRITAELVRQSLQDEQAFIIVNEHEDLLNDSSVSEEVRGYLREKIEDANQLIEKCNRWRNSVPVPDVLPFAPRITKPGGAPNQQSSSRTNLL